MTTTTIKISKEELNSFVSFGKAYVNTFVRSKLWFAIDKILRVTIKKLKKVEKEREEKRAEFAVKKDKGVYDLTPNGRWQFDEEGLKKLNAALEALEIEEIEIPTHVIPDGEYEESNLTFDFRDAFEGIVIPAIDYETFDIDKYVAPKEEKKE